MQPTKLLRLQKAWQLRKKSNGRVRWSKPMIMAYLLALVRVWWGHNHREQSKNIETACTLDWWPVWTMYLRCKVFDGQTSQSQRNLAGEARSLKFDRCWWCQRYLRSYSTYKLCVCSPVCCSCSDYILVSIISTWICETHDCMTPTRSTPT